MVIKSSWHFHFNFHRCRWPGRRPRQRYAAAACMVQLRREPTAEQALELAKRAAELMKARRGLQPWKNATGSNHFPAMSWWFTGRLWEWKCFHGISWWFTGSLWEWKWFNVFFPYVIEWEMVVELQHGYDDWMGFHGKNEVTGFLQPLWGCSSGDWV